MFWRNIFIVTAVTLVGLCAAIDVTLLADTTHHLTVYAHARAGEQGDCPYGGYTLSTTRNRNGNPLLIEQIMHKNNSYLPLITKGIDP